MSPVIDNAAREHVHDLTSDTATIPTDEMFDIMKTATRGDDVFGVSLARWICHQMISFVLFDSCRPILALMLIKFICVYLSG